MFWQLGIVGCLVVGTVPPKKRGVGQNYPSFIEDFAICQCFVLK